MHRLRAQCEIAKQELSRTVETSIEIEGFPSGDVDFIETISRTLFEQLNKELFEKTIEIVKQTLADARLSKVGINDVLLVGGSSKIPKVQTKIPKVQSMLAKFFEGLRDIKQTINADEAVAYGAAIQ